MEKEAATIPNWMKKKMINWLYTHLHHAELTIPKIQGMIHDLNPRREENSVFKSNEQLISDSTEIKRKRKQDAENKLWLKIPWSTKGIEDLNVARLLRDPDVIKHYPFPAEYKDITPTHKLNTPLGIILSTYGRESTNDIINSMNQPSLPSHLHCPCQKYKTDSSLELHGHIITTDPGAFKDAILRSLWLKGRKFRSEKHPGGIQTAISDGLNIFISLAVKRHRCKDSHAFSTWRKTLMQKIEEKIKELYSSPSETGVHFLSKEGKKEWEEVTQHMVVTYADKSAHDMVLACKPLYHKLLWEEIHSDVYDTTALTSDEIWNNHSVASKELGLLPIRANRYLYGIFKMHKPEVGIRWIAGNTLQDIGNGIFKPACSLTPVETTVGGILREVMRILETKDIQLRHSKKIKRYWIVTSVDKVASQIKDEQQRLTNNDVWTRDFTRMYTSLPQQAIISNVIKTIEEAIKYYAETEKVNESSVVFKMSYDSQGKATAKCCSRPGDVYAHKLEEIKKMIEMSVQEIYFSQSKPNHPPVPIRRQKSGVPMGGRHAAELANLYCYQCESTFIDNLIAKGQEEEARKWFDTWRYIDDMLGFSTRNWLDATQIPNYNMSHTDTTDGPGTAVFLGMRINQQKDSLILSVQPKGAGWKWIPNRFLEYSSCHTHYTKQNVYKGLLIRALTICNTINTFEAAYRHYAQGLIARGCPQKSLKYSWKKFMYSRVKASGQEKRMLNTNFYDWLEMQNFSHALPRTPLPEVQKQERLKERRSLLLCGLVAINHLLRHFKKDTLDRNHVDEINDILATEEIITAANQNDYDPVNHVDDRGNYPVQVLLSALEVYGHLDTKRWRPGQPITATAYLVGCGTHWTASIKDSQNLWYDKDSRTRSVVDIEKFFKGKDLHGAVYAVYPHPGTSQTMEVDNVININNDSPPPANPSTPSTTELFEHIQNLSTPPSPTPQTPNTPKDKPTSTPTSPPPNARKTGRKAAKALPDDVENRSARAEGHTSRVQENRKTNISRARSLPAKRVSLQEFKITIKGMGPLDDNRTKTFQSLLPSATVFESKENKDEDVNDGDDLPELIYNHLYSFLFNNKKDYDSAITILQSSPLFTQENYSLQARDQEESNDSKPWRSPERTRD